MQALHRSVAALAFALALLGMAAPADAALVAHWPFDGNANDASGNGHNGTPTGTVAYSGSVPGTLGAGQSLDLNGTTAWVDVAANPALNSTAFTLSFWINQNGAVQGGAHERTTGRAGYTFETALSSTGDLNYYPAPGWQSTGYSLRPSEWQHVAYVSDGATMRVYVGGRQWSSGGFAGNPNGFMRIGAAQTGNEAVQARMDDAALWDNPLSPIEVQAIAGGVETPRTLGLNELRSATVLSAPAQWSLSTVRESGGAAGTWAGPFNAPPATATFSLLAPAGTTAGIITAGNDFGSGGALRGDGGAGQPEGVQWYRTTFELGDYQKIAAHIVLAVDNGARVFINGTEIARETSFLVENWARPYSALTIGATGAIDGVTLFDWTAANFSGWLPGENEVILAIRNPDAEALNGGAIAFRMDIVSSVPEPASLALLALGGVGLLRRRRRRRRA